MNLILDSEGVVREGPHNGRQVGFIADDLVYQGGFHISGGHQVGYISGVNRPGFDDCSGYWVTASRAIGF